MGFDFVCVDIGASGTRVVSNDGVIYKIPNNAVFIDAGDKVDTAAFRGENLHDSILGALDVTIVKTSGNNCEHFPCRVLMGDIAERHSATCVRPSVLKNKAAQPINFVSAIVAAAHQQLVGATGSEVDMYLALPPMELPFSKDTMSSMLSGTYNVKFNKLDREIVVNIKTLTCIEEGFMALVAFFFNEDGSLREDAEQFAKGYVLSLDIGASTSDLAAAKDRRYVEKSGQTFKTGCNVIQAYVANVIRGKYGYDPTQVELDEVVATGRLPMGNRYVDMSDALRRAKSEFAASIVEQLQSYFRLVNIPLPMIRAIVVSGGGSLPSMYVDEKGKNVVTTGPVSEFITKELNNVVEGIEVLGVKCDAREANIIGAYIRALMIVARQKQLQAQNI